MPLEPDLLRDCRRGHAPSQEALYRRYWSFAMSVALRYAPTRDDALELCHDAYLRAFGALDRYEAGRPFKPWFRQILVRCAVDRHRSTRRHRSTVALDDEPPDAAVAPRPLDDLAAADVLRLLAVLPAVQRDVFNLYEVDGYSHDEIAGLLGIAPGTSRSHLTRAKARLRALYLHQTGTLP